ncbi:putative RNA helicase SDE3 [Camellia lanceoleosa]|uniref:RNA helicase SDE3 n=1 Tax=Camellia lanceoleosa TaxID=1840588 RepID=A0ACC0II36_9ERIC|nr:putative RNA helicase SDE3 [Camellia lanceoleosa]
MGVRELVENKQVPEVITQGLMKENYATYFNTLLNMEELYLKKEMRCHDMECITMRRKGANLLAWLSQFLGSLREGLLLCMVILLLQCLPLKVKMILLLHNRASSTVLRLTMCF